MKTTTTVKLPTHLKDQFASAEELREINDFLKDCSATLYEATDKDSYSVKRQEVLNRLRDQLWTFSDIQKPALEAGVKGLLKIYDEVATRL